MSPPPLNEHHERIIRNYVDANDETSPINIIYKEAKQNNNLEALFQLYMFFNYLNVFEDILRYCAEHNHFQSRVKYGELLKHRNDPKWTQYVASPSADLMEYYAETKHASGLDEQLEQYVHTGHQRDGIWWYYHWKLRTLNNVCTESSEIKTWLNTNFHYKIECGNHQCVSEIQSLENALEMLSFNTHPKETINVHVSLLIMMSGEDTSERLAGATKSRTVTRIVEFVLTHIDCVDEKQLPQVYYCLGKYYTTFPYCQRHAIMYFQMAAIMGFEKAKFQIALLQLKEQQQQQQQS